MTGSGGAEAGQCQHPACLLEKLMAAVRPEFRAGVLTFDPRDPVFGGPPCAVPGCERPARIRDLCWSHRQRWHDAGKPGLAVFTASTSPDWAGRRPPLACAVPGCNYCHRGRGLCQLHHQHWGKAGRPGISSWLPALDYAPPSPPPDACAVPGCDRWAMPTTPFCHTHCQGWRRAGLPSPASSPPPAPIPAWGMSGSTCAACPACCGWKSSTCCNAAGTSASRGCAPAGCSRSCGTWPPREPPRCWTGPKNNGRRPGRGASAPAAAASSPWTPAPGSSSWPSAAAGTWSTRAASGGCATWASSPGRKAATIDFAPIGQPWLAALAKRWCRWRLSAGLSAGEAAHGIRVIRRFSAFLAAHAPGGGPASIDRPLLERYLADLSASLGPRSRHGHVSALNGFFRDTRRHGWDDGSLPAAAVFYPEDYPKPGQRLPRAVAAHVMAQVENPANLDRWGNPAYRLLTVILIRCGLRISSAVSLSWDCVVSDAADAPYLRYCNTKMKREALVPIDDELRAMISAQHDRVRLQWPDGTPVLFPRPLTNLAGTRPIGGATYREALYRWLADCDIRDEHGTPVHLTPHQWRHTLGTVLINRDVPQHVVQKILDHDSPLMTALYARLSDKTVREHWEKARKVGAEGQPVQISPDGPLGDAAWAKQQLSRATQALPNGYCQLPLVKTCPHANSCLTCPMFVTTAEFLPQHHAQRQATLQIISAAEANGQARVAEMNRQVAGNLDKIITALEAQGPDEEAAAGAS